jgi:hypothetical protein
MQRARNYYRKSRISPEHFTCGHKKECQADCPKFTGPKEPHIGSKYELGHYPRILFLSLDPGLEQNGSYKRTAPEVRKWAEACIVEKCPKGSHWYVTHEMAIELLKAYKPGLSLNNVAPYFAHSNAAKCCQNKVHRKQADAKLFRNCSDYIGGELEILQPNVLVTQGMKAFEAAKHAIGDETISSLSPLTWPAAKKGTYGVLEIGGRKVLWFATLHPKARKGMFQRQRKLFWKKWSVVIGRRGLILTKATRN